MKKNKDFVKMKQTIVQQTPYYTADQPIWLGIFIRRVISWLA